MVLAGAVVGIVNAANVRFEIPGLEGDLQFRLQVTPALLALVIGILGCLVLGVTRVGSGRFLRKSILELIGGAGC
jgi:hypothetical protein